MQVKLPLGFSNIFGTFWKETYFQMKYFDEDENLPGLLMFNFPKA